MNLTTLERIWSLLPPVGLGFVFMFLSTPLWIKVAVNRRMFDLPGGRKTHAGPVPFCGGLAVGFGFFFILLLLKGPDFPHFFTLFIGGALILFLGYLDDRYNLSPWIKLLGQVIISSLTAGFGLRILFLTNPFGQMVTLGWVGYPLTVIWLLATMNMINLIDGLDGLAAGISLIVAVSLMIIGLELGQIVAAFLCALLIGVLGGFLPYNFSQARIFLGNSGAYFLGYIIGVISVLGALKVPTVLALAVPVFALGVPVLDTIWAIWRRWRSGRPITTGDRGHIHHLLVYTGLGEKKAVLCLYGCSLALGIGSIFLSRVTLLLGTVILFFGGGVGFFIFRSLNSIQSAAEENSPSGATGEEKATFPGPEEKSMG